MAKASRKRPRRGANGPDRRWLPDAQEYAGAAGALTRKLQDAVAALPKVAPDGSSECPFAEALYARKEELEPQLSGQVNLLQGHLEALEKKLRRCRERLSVIRRDKSQLASHGAIDEYSQAEREQRKKCLALARQRIALLRVIGQARAALAASRSKKYPGKKPGNNPASAINLPLFRPQSQQRHLGSARRLEPLRAPTSSIGALLRLRPMGNSGWYSPP